MAVSDAVISRYSPRSASLVVVAVAPNPPAITDRNFRFIALHMMFDR